MNLSDENGKSGKNKKVLLISIGAALLVFLCGCLISILVLSNDSSFGMDELVKFNNDTNLIFIFGLILIASLFLMIFPIVLIMIVRWRNTKTMDGIFEPLGLTGSPYILTGRQYHGVFRGRQVDVYIIRGPTIEIKMHGKFHTHFQAIQAGNIHKAVLTNAREDPFIMQQKKLQDVLFYGADEHWLNELFIDEHAVNALLHLLYDGSDWTVLRRVEVTAGEAGLIIHRSKKLMFTLDMMTNEVSQFLDYLLSLSQSMERAPQPAELEEIPEQSGRNAARSINPKVVAIIIVLMVAVPGCLITAGFVVALLASGSI